MPIEGYVDYKRREYCNDVKCLIQMLLNKESEGSPKYDEIRAVCKSNCIHTTHEFHYWLIQNGFEVVKPKDA